MTTKQLESQLRTSLLIIAVYLLCTGCAMLAAPRHVASTMNALARAASLAPALRNEEAAREFLPLMGGVLVPLSFYYAYNARSVQFARSSLYGRAIATAILLVQYARSVTSAIVLSGVIVDILCGLWTYSILTKLDSMTTIKRK